MKRLITVSGIAFALLTGSSVALAQAAPPPMPSLTPQQSAIVQQRVDAYRQQTESRVARGEITADEADRLVQWREWQIARQVGGARASPPRAAIDRDAPQDYRDAPQDYRDAPQDYRDAPLDYRDAPQDYRDAPQDYRDAPQDYRDAPPDYRGAPSGYYDSRPRDYVVVEPAPSYGPYYRYATPYAWAPRPYYWGPAVCAGGFGRHFGGRICF